MGQLSTFESKLIEENQKLLKKLDQQTQLLTSYDQKIFEQDQTIQQLTEQVEFLSKKLFGSSSEKTKVDPGQLTLFGDPVLEEPLTKDQTIQQLTEQVEFLSKKLFGSSSEKTKVDPGQLTLFGDPVLEEPLTKDEPTEEITYRRRKTSGRKAELTKDLPVEEIHCELHGEDCTCDHCGQAMKPMGKKVVREEVCFIPARLYKKVYISHTYECDCHDPNFEAKPSYVVLRCLRDLSNVAWQDQQHWLGFFIKNLN